MFKPAVGGCVAGCILGALIFFLGNQSQSVQVSAAERDGGMAPAMAVPPAVREVRAASDAFYAALGHMFKGDLAPMSDVWAHTGVVTLLGPFGGRQTGWEAVRKEFEREAGMKFGGHVEAKELMIEMAGDVAYTVCVEEGRNLTVAGAPIVVRHRATNIFRRLDGRWKMVHHHTDVNPVLERAVKKP